MERYAFYRKKVLVVLLLGLTGCSRMAWLDSASQAIQLQTVGVNTPPVSREQATTLPYASIMAKVGKTPWSFMILSHMEGAMDHWVGADRSLLVTRHGRFVRTVGLPRDLLQVRSREEDPVARGLHGLTTVVSYRRQVDLAVDLYGVPVNCQLTPLGRERIEILERFFDVVRVDEACEAPTMDWSFVNTFWADAATGFVWRSVQHVTPDLSAIEVRVVKAVDPGHP